MMAINKAVETAEIPNLERNIKLSRHGPRSRPVQAWQIRGMNKSTEIMRQISHVATGLSNGSAYAKRLAILRSRRATAN
jgi:hypothetical protein